jgi:hypothetical protein
MERASTDKDNNANNEEVPEKSRAKFKKKRRSRSSEDGMTVVAGSTVTASTQASTKDRGFLRGPSLKPGTARKKKRVTARESRRVNRGR